MKSLKSRIQNFIRDECQYSIIEQTGDDTMPEIIIVEEEKYIVMTEDECDGLIELARLSEMFSVRHLMEMIK